MSKVGAVSIMLAIASLFLVVLLIFLVSATTEQYTLGEKVKINIGEIGEYTLGVKTPSQTLLYKSSSSYFVFQPETLGKYSIQIKSKSTSKEIEFEVVSSKSQPIIQIPIEELDYQSPKQQNLSLSSQNSSTSENPIIGLPVIWKKEVQATGKDIEIKIPESSSNISLIGANKEIDFKLKKSLTDRISNLLSDEPQISLTITSPLSNFEIEYTTPAPEKTEKQISETKKEIKISSDIHYENVLAYTSISETLRLNQRDSIRIYWKEEGSYLDFESKDEDGNGIIDKIEWIVPHLSTQTFEIIIITKAEHLDTERNFIKNIYESVKEQDNIWSDIINENEYVRVKFEKPLSNKKDISIFPKIISGNPSIEVYEINKQNKIAEFTNIISNQYNKIYLTALEENYYQDIFDLKILNGKVIFDHIIDPTENIWSGSNAGAGGVIVTNTGNADSSTTSNWASAVDDNNRWGRDGGSWTFTMDNSGVGVGAINGVDLYLKQYQSGHSDDSFVIEVYDGAGWISVQTYGGTSPPTSDTTNNWDVSSVLDTWTKIDAAQVRIRGTGKASGDDAVTWYIDTVELRVDYEEADTIPPKVTINSPQNITYNPLSYPIIFNVTLDEAGDSCLYNINGGTNISMTSSDSLTWSASNSSMAAGQYTTYFYCNDTSGNLNGTESIIFSFELGDTTPPLVSINFPENKTYSNTDLPLNFNIALNENGTVWYSLDGGTTNISMTTSDNINFYDENNSIADGTYTFQAYANDTTGNTNFDESIVFTFNSSADTLPPEVTINFPANTTYTDEDLPFLFEVSLNENGTAWYSLDGGTTNISMTTSDNINFNATNLSMPAGTYTFNVYANDTTGNTNFTQSIVFTMTLTEEPLWSGSNAGVSPLTVTSSTNADTSSTGDWASATGNAWPRDNGEWVFTIADSEISSGVIESTYLYLKHYQSGLSNDLVNIDVYDGTSWTTVQTYIGGDAPLSDTTDSWNISSILDTWTKIDAAQVRIYGNGKVGGNDVVTWFVDTVEIRVDYTSSDIVPPEVTINFPTNTTYGNADLPLNFSINLSETGTAWYSLDGGTTNISMTTSDNINFYDENNSIADGTYTFQAYANDTEGNNNFSESVTFTFDSTPPTVTLVSPPNESTITDSFKLEFKYNITDTASTINNCSIYVDGVIQRTENTITKNVNQSIFQYMENGNHEWFIECYDIANNIGRSENRTVTINIPSQPEFEERFWETGTQDFTGNNVATINLNNTRDAAQNTAAFTISPSTLENIVSAGSWFISNNGATIPSGTIIDFSASWIITNNDVEGTWKLYISNSTGDTLLCQNGDDGSGGTPVSAGTISSSNTTCIDSDIRLQKSDRLLLVLNAYNTNPTLSRSVTHAWDGGTSSFVDISLTTEGFIEVNLTSPLSDPSIAVAETFDVYCNTSCSAGTCTNTDVYVQYNTSIEGWANINATSGNLILAPAETNPHPLGDISANIQTIFTLEGNAESISNIRCIAIGDYDSTNGSVTTPVTVGVIGPTAPNVNLTNPDNKTWFNISTVELFYNISDVNNNLANSTLIINGALNETNKTPLLNNQINNFTISLPDGAYSWTVNSTDATGLEGTDNIARIFYVDTTHPTFNLHTPADDDALDVSTIEFNFTVSDNLDSILVCNLTIDGIIETENFDADNNIPNNKTINDISIGDHLWNITCIDEAGNINTSETRNFSVSDLPPTVALVTVNNSFSITGDIVLEYNATDNNGLVNATLYINGAENISNQSLMLNGDTNNFTLTGYPEGVYTWDVSVTDTNGFTAMNGTPRTFTIDLNDPSVILNLPDNNSILENSTVNLNFTATDTMDSSLSCTVYFGELTDGTFEVGPVLTNRQFISVTDGQRLWNVSCVDDSGRSKISETRTIDVAEKPTIQLETPNKTFFDIDSFNLSYLPSDNTNLSVCELYIDGTFNQSNSTPVNNGEQNNFTVLGIASGEHTWYVSCNDTIALKGNSEIRIFTVDIDVPTILLIAPSPGEQLFTDSINFSYNASDNLDTELECNITVDSELEDSYNATSGAITNRTIVFSTGGYKEWEVTCMDDAKNIFTSETRNFTLSFAPVVTLISPENNSSHNSSTINFYYNVTDANEDIVNSTLIFNGAENQTNQTQIINGGTSNFTLNLADGHYNWTVNVTDATSLIGTATPIFFTVDTVAPNVTLFNPLKGETLDWNNITFNFSASDNLDPTITCNLTINDNQEIESINIANGSTSQRYIIKDDGVYNWSLDCTDDAGNRNTIEGRNFTVEAPPKITNLEPVNKEFFNTSSVDFVYLPEDAIGIFNCSIFIDGIFNDSYDTISENTNNTFTVNGIPEGHHNWTVECADVFPDFNIGVSESTNFTIDLTPPSIALSAPANLTNLDANNNVVFGWTATDILDTLLVCNLVVDGNIEDSGFATSGSPRTEPVSGLSVGQHFWNVTCTDQAGNSNTSETRQFNYTYPDFLLNETLLTISNDNPTENETVTINATVYNLGGADVTSVQVKFYNGDPETTGVQIGTTQNIFIAGNSQNSASIEWDAPLGSFNIYAIVDFPDIITELNETNNKANKSLSVESWHYFYGNINPGAANFTLTDSYSYELTNWNLANMTGANIYVADYDSNINWSSLQAIGKKASGAPSTNDIQEIDSSLSMTAFKDSHAALYLNSTSEINETRDYKVFARTITNVPVATSIISNNFKTGILWDTSDDTNTEYDESTDKEDLIYITKINKNQPGSYETADYELRVPANLRSYNPANSQTAVFYLEII